MAKTLVSLTLGESKSKVDLSLESKDASMTWNDATMTWDEQTSTWNQPKLVSVREAKTKGNLTLE